MGYRIHVASTYQVEYRGYPGRFSYCVDIINDLLYELCPKAWFSDDSTSNSDRIKVNREELKEAITKLNENKEKYVERLKEYTDFDYTVDDIIDAMQGWIDTSDQRNDYVVLHWI